MALNKFVQLYFVVLSMISTCLGCVQYIGDWDSNTGYYWAQLIDNGEIICSATTKYEIGVLTADNIQFTLSGCLSGYDVTFNFDTKYVGYSYGSYSSGFGTDETQLEAGYWQYVANVWGCAK